MISLIKKQARKNVQSFLQCISGRFENYRGRLNLDLAWVHHDSDPLSHGLGRKVASELGAHGTSVSMRTGHLAPNTPHVRLLSLSGNGGLVLSLVDVGAPLANIPASLLLVGGALDLEKSSVLVLVPLTSLVAGEHSLGIQTSCGGSHFLLSCRSESSNKSL